jgi:AcrR family transcriptional regulator
MSSAADPSTDGRAIRGQATRDRIVQAAREILIEQGHGGASTRAVADRAGVRLSLVHYHFGGRPGLLAEVLERDNEQLLERQRELFDAPGTLAEKWRMACDLLDEDIRSGYVRLQFELWGAGLVDEDLAAGWRSALKGWRELLASVFERWAQQHEIELPLRPQALAALVANLFEGIEVEMLGGVSEDDAPHREVLDYFGELIARAEARP